jgi:hypothetical protein
MPNNRIAQQQRKLQRNDLVTHKRCKTVHSQQSHLGQNYKNTISQPTLKDTECNNRKYKASPRRPKYGLQVYRGVCEQNDCVKRLMNLRLIRIHNVTNHLQRQNHKNL